MNFPRMNGKFKMKDFQRTIRRNEVSSAIINISGDETNVEKDDKDKNKKDILRSIPFFVWIGVSFALLFYGAADQQRYWICGIALGVVCAWFWIINADKQRIEKTHTFCCCDITAFGVIGLF